MFQMVAKQMFDHCLNSVFDVCTYSMFESHLTVRANKRTHANLPWRRIDGGRKNLSTHTCNKINGHGNVDRLCGGWQIVCATNDTNFRHN